MFTYHGVRYSMSQGVYGEIKLPSLYVLDETSLSYNVLETGLYKIKKIKI